MTNLRYFVLFCFCVCSSLTLEFANIGDSWGTSGFKVYQQKVTLILFKKNQCKQIKPNASVKRFAIGGTTAAQWASAEGALQIAKIVLENPNLSHIWLTVGGNGKKKLIKKMKTQCKCAAKENVKNTKLLF
jgi:hypothetical protein